VNRVDQGITYAIPLRVRLGRRWQLGSVASPANIGYRSPRKVIALKSSARRPTKTIKYSSNSAKGLGPPLTLSIRTRALLTGPRLHANYSRNDWDQIAVHAPILELPYSSQVKSKRNTSQQHRLARAAQMIP